MGREQCFYFSRSSLQSKNLQKYIAYYHEDRTHIALEKTTPAADRLSPS
jgi:hypothetical protein